MRDYVRADDPDNGSQDLYFIVVDTPRRGRIMRYEDTLTIGDTFLAGDASFGGVTYVDEGQGEGTDELLVVLSDNAGNVVATPRIVFNIAEGFITSTEDLQSDEALGLHLAPNPTRGWSRLLWDEPSAGGTLTLFDLQGRSQWQRSVNPGRVEEQLDLSSYPAGVYILHYRGVEGTRSLRVVRE